MMVVRVPPWVAAALQSSAGALKIRAEYSGRCMQNFSMQPRWHLLPHPAGQPAKMPLSFCGISQRHDAPAHLRNVTQAISGKLGMSSAMALSLNSSMSLPPKT